MLGGPEGQTWVLGPGPELALALRQAGNGTTSRDARMGSGSLALFSQTHGDPCHLPELLPQAREGSQWLCLKPQAPAPYTARAPGVPGRAKGSPHLSQTQGLTGQELQGAALQRDSTGPAAWAPHEDFHFHQQETKRVFVSPALEKRPPWARAPRRTSSL